MVRPLHEDGEGKAEADIDDVDKLVSATVLRAETPVQICKIAAGLHQARQRATSEQRFSNIVAGIVRCMKEVAPYQTDQLT